MDNKKELTTFEHQIIESTIGTLTHEGYVDDGVLKQELECIFLGDISLSESIENSIEIAIEKDREVSKNR